MRFGWHCLPNILTFFRMALIVPFAVVLYREQFVLALFLFLFAGLSDGVDGFLARRFGWYSRFGAIADPLADKALLLTTYAVLALIHLIPLGLLLLIVLRDMVIVIGALLYHFLIGRYDMQPSWLGKANTFIQILLVVMLMADQAGFPIPAGSLPAGIVVVALLAIVSGCHYMLVWGLKAWREVRS